MNRRYNTLDTALKAEFGSKTIKLSLDGGFSCPNRDGTKGVGGCIFCGELGAGEFSGCREVDIKEQIEDQKELLKTKWAEAKYLAYFQNFTSTYGEINRLKKVYDEALDSNVSGLVIATRPDCINDEILELLAYYNERTFLWVELGLQSMHQSTADTINRCYKLSEYDNAVKMLHSKKIKIVTHLIYGLPGETHDNMLESAKYVGDSGVWGIKIHSLYVGKKTLLEQMWRRGEFKVLDRDEYVDLIVKTIAKLPPEIVIHRLTGDGKKEETLAPMWAFDKLKLLAEINGELKRRNIVQGCEYKL